MSEKRLRIARRPSKRQPAYWRRRLFRNQYAYKGKRTEVSSWSVKIQLFGKRKSFTLVSEDRARAAREACRLYRTILEHGWEAMTSARAGTGGPHRVLLAPGVLSSSVRQDGEYVSALLPSGQPFWKLAKLTPREHEILVFLSKGDLVKEIAGTLRISTWTVRGHVKRIFEKLEVHTRTEAVIKYLQN